MKKATLGMRIFFAVSLGAPLLYLLMYVPIWNGKELLLTDSIAIMIFALQCLALLSAVAHLCFRLFKKEYPQFFSVVSVLLTLVSVGFLCFVGYLFVLELFNVPWFPAQR